MSKGFSGLFSGTKGFYNSLGEDVFERILPNGNKNIDFSNLQYITQSIHNTKMKSSKVMKNDVMIAIVGATIGQIGINTTF